MDYKSFLGDKVPHFVRAVPGGCGVTIMLGNVQTGQMVRKSPGEGLGSFHARWDGLESIESKRTNYGERGRVTCWVDCWPRSRKARFRWLRIASGRSVWSLLLGIDYFLRCASSWLVLQSVYIFA